MLAYLWKDFEPSLKGVYRWLQLLTISSWEELKVQGIHAQKSTQFHSKMLNWNLKLDFDLADAWSMMKNAILVSKIK